MAAQRVCDRCGKTLRPGVGPDGPMHVAVTGETICGDCMMKMLATVSPPVNDNFEVKTFSKEAIDELAKITGVKPSSISMHCEQFMSYDVEVKIDSNIYQIVYIYDLIEDKSRWRKTRDYVVSWIKQNPLSNRAWNAQTSANQHLVTNGRFVFIFVPDTYPQPLSNFGAQVAQELCRPVDATRIGWMVCPISTASQESENQEVASTLKRWAGMQSHPDSLKFNMKKVKFHFSRDREITCVIVQQ